MEESGNYITHHLVNKRQIWMQRKTQLSLSNTLSRLHLQEETPPPPQQDRISTLPDEILHRILSLIPMEMAIRTSILSKSWRHLWKYTRVVDFHSLPFSSYKVDYTSITRSLDLIESPHIESFTVVSHVDDYYHPEVRKWVDFALSKNVHTLRIGLMKISSRMRFFQLPKSLFTENDQTQKLKVLFLSCVDYTPPRGVIFSGSGFASLQTLVFTNCKLSDRIVELFLLKCLVLEVLVLDMCRGLANVNISGSNLKLKQLIFKWYEYDHCEYGEIRLLEVDAPYLLTLIYSGDLTRILLKNCQGLGKIILLGKSEQIKEANIDHIRDLLIQVTQVKTLGVNFQFLQLVARDRFYTWGGPFLEFENLEHLFWCDSLGSPNDVYNLVAFLGECPSLEDCVIDFREECWAAFCDTMWENYVEHGFFDFEDVLDKPYHGRCLKKLKSIRVICFSGFYGEMMLLRLLLEKAVNLQKLELLWRNDISIMTDNVLQSVFTIDDAPNLVAKIQEDSNSIKEKVNSFPKASPNAQILYKRKWEFCEWYNIFGA